MGLFENLFGCVCNNNGQSATNDTFTHDIKEIRKDVKAVENDIKQLFGKELLTTTELNRLEDKVVNNFSILTNKIDNVIMILNSKK